MTRPKISPIWNFFKETGTEGTKRIVLCNLCLQKKLFGMKNGRINKTNLEWHLKKHKSDYKIYEIQKQEKYEQEEAKKLDLPKHEFNLLSGRPTLVIGDGESRLDKKRQAKNGEIMG